MFQVSNVALSELGTFKFRFRTTEIHTTEAIFGRSVWFEWEFAPGNWLELEKGDSSN